MFRIRNKTAIPLAIYFGNFEGVDPDEALVLEVGEATDLGDLDNEVVIIIKDKEESK